MEPPARSALRLPPPASLAVLLIVFLGVLAVSGKLTDLLDLGVWSATVAGLLPAAAAVLTLVLLGYRFTGTGDLLRGLAWGWYVPVASGIIAVLTAVTYLGAGGYFSATPSDAAGAVLAQLLVATTEELFFRVGVLGLLVVWLLRSGAMGPRGVVVLSAAMFGVVHLANLLENPNGVVGAVTQVIYAFCIGMLLGAIWLRTRSAAAVILLHFLFNCGSTVGAMFDPAWSTAIVSRASGDASLGSALFINVLTVPAALIGWMLLSPRRLTPPTSPHNQSSLS